MEVALFSDAIDPSLSPFEVVERKGRGHPDTLADRLAEALSREYSLICRDQFGTILRHQFDKLSLMGGKCDVRFGGGNFISPIRLLLNGRATPAVGDQKVDFRDRLIDRAATFLEAELKNFDFHSNCRVMLEITSHTTRGVNLESGDRSAAYSRFRPGHLTDLPEFTRPLSNDTALGCAWAPYSPLEQLVLAIEGTLNSDETRTLHPWLGGDIKTMAVRTGTDVSITICVPQIATEVPSYTVYSENLAKIDELIEAIILPFKEHFSVTLSLTPGDRTRVDLAYLLLTGSCVESGDEGQVARGNRLGGLISSRRPFSIEGLCGKNPQYHGGKIYAAVSWGIANEIWNTLGAKVEVFIVSQTDRPLDDPWKVIVNSPNQISVEDIHPIIIRHLEDIGRVTDGLVRGDYPLA